VAAEEKQNDDRVEPGLSCSRCRCGDLPVYYTRQQVRGVIHRVRRCRHCGKLVPTRGKPIGKHPRPPSGDGATGHGGFR